MLRFAWICAVFIGVVACAADTPATPYPLWDGRESIEQYAERVNLPPTKTLDLGNGVTMDLVLIPAGKFIMGTPQPEPLDETLFRRNIIIGQAVFAAAVGALLVLIAVVMIRAIRQRHRPQYSLARFIVTMLAASVAVVGGMHWWHSRKGLYIAEIEHKVALARYNEASDVDTPGHEVTLTRLYYIGRYEVTQEQYQEVMGTNPSRFNGVTLPVERVSWDDVEAFCKKVSKTTGYPIRLPTEAEWEYACRAGTRTYFCSGDAETDLDTVGWYYHNSKKTTHPIGQKKPNSWGIYDMHGNVWEWCYDWCDELAATPSVDPQGASTSDCRVIRGGAWNRAPNECRSGRRASTPPDIGGPRNSGFRVVVEVPPTNIQR